MIPEEKVFPPPRLRMEVLLFWMTPVTPPPMTPLIVVVPDPVPEFVTVPKVPILPVTLMAPPELAWRVRLLVPLIVEELKVSNPVPL